MHVINKPTDCSASVQICVTVYIFSIAIPSHDERMHVKRHAPFVGLKKVVKKRKKKKTRESGGERMLEREDGRATGRRALG